MNAGSGSGVGVRVGVVASSGGARQVVDLAVEAEAHGWDGFFTWDGIDVGAAAAFDPWALLAAAAVRTERILLGALVFAPARRRPWVVAQQAVTVDHLSGGRLVVPVGLGAGDDRAFAGVRGEAATARERAQRLDEALAVLDLAFTGERFDHDGPHLHVEGLRIRPLPVQRPRPPVWVVGAWPSERSMARAARWDGVVVQGLASFAGTGVAMVADVVAWVREHRPAGAGPFDVVVQGVLPQDPSAAADLPAALGAAGATWWVESRWDAETGSPAALLERVRSGPLG